MMRMSQKKLRKIGDPENLLHRAVLINNTLECIRLPAPITPISDTQDITEDNNENKDSISDVAVDYIERTLPNTRSDVTKYDPSTNSDTSGSNDQNNQNCISEEDLLSQSSLKI